MDNNMIWSLLWKQGLAILIIVGIITIISYPQIVINVLIAVIVIDIIGIMLIYINNYDVLTKIITLVKRTWQ